MPTQYTVRVFVGVAAADQVQANQIASDLGLGPNNWTVPIILTSDPQATPARAYLADIQMTPAQGTALRSAVQAAGIEARGARTVRTDPDPRVGTPDRAAFLTSRGWKFKR